MLTTKVVSGDVLGPVARVFNNSKVSCQINVLRAEDDRRRGGRAAVRVLN